MVMFYILFSPRRLQLAIADQMAIKGTFTLIKVNVPLIAPAKSRPV
jgi:hypothetical protein